MGKIRVKTLGDETLEKEQQKKVKQKSEQKKFAKVAGKGGERVVVVGATEEDLEQLATDNSLQTTAAVDGSPKTVDKVKKPKSTKARERSKKYKAAKILVDPAKQYSVSEALELLPKLKLSKFDETVELHINALETGISGNLTLPHGTGKTTKVVIADDAVIAKIEKGKIEFDILVATPAMMPKLARVAKVLGPRGLMPNPKNGTITDKPEDVAKKFEGGQMRYKTEAKSPIIHLTVGKLSFGDKKLTENIDTIFKAIPAAKIRKVILKSTMSPGIKIDTAAL